MKKIISIAVIASSITAVYALSSASLKENLNQIYTSISSQATNYYKNATNQVKQIETNLQTGDYKVLTQLTGINTQSTQDSIKTTYTNFLQDLTTKKYNILSEIETNDNNFQNQVISTGDYENNLSNIAVEISGYQAQAENNLKAYQETLSGFISKLNQDIKNKYNYYKTDLEHYKNFEKQLKDINRKYQKLQELNSQLNKVIGLSQEVFQKKADDITKYVSNYFSGLIENEYQKYLQQDPNMAYFASGIQLKKEILIGFAVGKIKETINQIIKNYYPDIDMDNLDKQIQKLNNLSVQEIVKNYNNLEKEIENIQTTITDYQNKIQEKLQKFPKTDENTILDILKNDLINSLNQATKLIQEDIKNTLDSRLTFVKTREKIEQPLVEKVTQIYSQNITGNNLNELEQLKNTILSYQTIILLPQNKQIIQNYLNVINQKIKELKFKQLEEEITSLANKINQLGYDNLDKIKEYEQKVNQLIKELKNNPESPEKLIQTLQKLLIQLQVKENLNKLYKCGAIRYYYQYGDLSETVNQILQKFYKKYKEKGKEKVFMEKINKAFEKLEILEQNLNPDLRSYYIIMIHNGLIKFKYRLNETENN